jgi:hypothetical protein
LARRHVFIWRAKRQFSLLYWFHYREWRRIVSRSVLFIFFFASEPARVAKAGAQASPVLHDGRCLIKHACGRGVDHTCASGVCMHADRGPWKLALTSICSSFYLQRISMHAAE